MQLGGFMAFVVLPIYSTTATVVMGPTNRPPNGHLACQIMQHYHLRALFCPPIIFEQLVQEPEGLEQAKRLDFLLYAGGPLSASTGNLLSQVTDVCQFYGSTETGAVSTLVPRREDWASLEWHPSYGVDMQPCGDDAYEMVLHRDPKLQSIRSFSCNFPDVAEWHTRDLFRPQPGKPTLWRFYCRRDDIIILSNGEKFNPVPSEAIIAGHHLLSAALIVGLGRFQAALLVEPRAESGIEKDPLIEEVWSTVEQANAQAPGHARIIRSMIAVANTNKRFERAGKGTVIRKMTAEKFASEIEALYSKDNAKGLGPCLGAIDDFGAIRAYVRECVGLSFPSPSFDDGDDLYVLGLDSLKTMEIAGMLKAGLTDPNTQWLSAQTIYANPTIGSLSKVIHKRLSPKGKASDEDHGREQSRITKMTSLIQKYTQGLPTPQLERNRLLNSSKLNVALTGSTGSLGTRILRALLDDTKISRIYCLNRSTKARAHQEESFKHLGFAHKLDPSQVEFIEAEYGHSTLGLAEAGYQELTSSVDIIIHNAWKVDFNHSLESFEPVHIRGIRNLIDWSTSSKRHPHIIFISSISSVGNWKDANPNKQVSESPISNLDSAQDMGYGESKNVAECILNAAIKKSGVPVSILRVGQIAGPVTTAGIWNRDEWFPSLIKTSQSLGRLPSYLPDADWIPVDILAVVILDIVHYAVNTEHARIYNIVNPKPTPWTSLVNTVLERLSPQTRVIELREWIQMLTEIDQNDSLEVSTKPAAKILQFYRDLEAAKLAGELKYSTAHGIAASKTMDEMEPVSTKWMKTWLDQWAY